MKFTVHRSPFITIFLLLTVFGLLSGCSVPNLEAPECTESRQAVKEFYSFHFGGEMRRTPENLKLREKFLTPEYYRLLTQQRGEGDSFTTGGDADFPKTFRIGKCEVETADRTNVEVVLFWKDDARSEQREIRAAVVKENGKWLIGNIYN